jgi:hypothetical protein
MKPRLTVALAVVGMMVALVIVIYALMPRYFLIVALPDRPFVQLGPFATQLSCQDAAKRLVDALAGDEHSTEQDRQEFAAHTVCLSSR